MLTRAVYSDLPIEPVIPAIRDALKRGNRLVLQAPPGAGKTTRVPLALVGEAWLAGQRILMLEPRRLATRAAARRMAATLGEAVGGTVGYRMRLDSQVGPHTRIEVVTDGILLRMLQDDPGLVGVGAVIFDEFHERGLDGDLGLALCLEAQRHLREELRLVVMSATLDGARIAARLGDAPVIVSEGRSFPVETRYLPRPAGERVEDGVIAGIRLALAEEAGSLLVFLPGAGEIRRVERGLAELGLGDDIAVAPLYGDLAQAAQDAALQPAAPGRRKIVLATAIAETSLTIEGIRVVIDSGRAREPRFEPRSGLTRLATVPVSQASAEQRRGRAGRLAPGVCYRLWSAAEQRALPAQAIPEILAADLAPLALELACWGAEATALAWLDPPPAPALAQARDLLGRLDALDPAGRVTGLGRAMAQLGVHPRLAHMMLRAVPLGLGGLACDLAALLAARDVLRPLAAVTGPRTIRETDLRLRLELLAGAAEPAGFAVDRPALRQARRQAVAWRRRVGAPTQNDAAAIARAGLVLALAYPDRIAQRRRAADGTADRIAWRLSNGRGATLAASDPLAAADFLAVAELDGDRRAARIFLAAPLTRGEIEVALAAALEWLEVVTWDAREQSVLAERQQRLGALALRRERLTDPSPAAVEAALLSGLREAGLGVLNWNEEARQLRARVAFLARLQGERAGWPDLSDVALLADLEEWLAPALAGLTRLSQLARLDLGRLLRGRLDRDRRRALDELAPPEMVVPSGARRPVDYAASEEPILAVRLQEMFGSSDGPRVAGGRVPLRLALLSPAGRPLQVTSDLAGFWATGYRAVRAEMRGRYPRHSWPEDPAAARPTARAGRRRG